jgi:hypothetical protein
MMAYDYIPRRESELVTFTGTLLENVSGEPGRFGIDRSMVDSYRLCFERFAQSFAVAQNPETRTKSNVGRKNECKQELLSATRRMVDVMQAWPGMTDVKRDELGITVYGPRRRRVPVPMSSPGVKLIADGRNVSIELDSGVSRSKPDGAVGALIFLHYGDEPPATATGWNFLAMTGRSRVTAMLDGVREACTVWITACWFSGRMEAGPFGAARSINLAKSEVVPMSSLMNIAA